MGCVSAQHCAPSCHSQRRQTVQSHHGEASTQLLTGVFAALPLPSHAGQEMADLVAAHGPLGGAILSI
jgi:hypothetical protein